MPTSKPHPLKDVRLYATGALEDGYLVGNGALKPKDAAGNTLKKTFNVPRVATAEQATALLETFINAHGALLAPFAKLSASRVTRELLALRTVVRSS